MKSRKVQVVPILLLAVGGLLLVLAAGLLLSQNSATPATPSPSVAGASAEETYPEIKRVSMADAKAALDSGTAVFVDVRDAESYAISHIPGALSIPGAYIETRLSELDRQKWIITYCT
jgi:3-mercaptopyruvate sulfurtransferase SseA